LGVLRRLSGLLRVLGVECDNIPRLLHPTLTKPVIFGIFGSISGDFGPFLGHFWLKNAPKLGKNGLFSAIFWPKNSIFGQKSKTAERDSLDKCFLVLINTIRHLGNIAV